MSDPYFSVIGIDPSLTGTGVGVIRGDGGGITYAVRTFGRKGRTSETLVERLNRITTITGQVRDVIRGLGLYPDLIAIETPAYGQTSGSHHDRSGLWWDLVRELTYEAGLDVMEIGIGKVKTYATGKGNSDKDAVLAATVRRYPEAPISNNNEADAFVLAAMAARLIGESIDGLPKTHLRAMEGLVRP